MRAVWYDRQGPAGEVLTRGDMSGPGARHRRGAGAAPGLGREPGRLPDARRVDRSRWPIRASCRTATARDGSRRSARASRKVWVGKRVWLYNGQRNGRAFGTAAERIALAVDLLSPLPDRVSFAEGATLGIPCMTAHRCVFVAGPVQGRRVLVTGGAGAVGHYAVQLAKWAGATVFATVSSDEKAARARAGGAEHIIDYRRQDVAAEIARLTGGTGVDHVVEIEFGGNLAATMACVRDNGSIATYASSAERTPRLPIYELMRRNLSLHTIYLPGSPLAARQRAQSDITAWIGSGERILAVAGCYPLAETAAAHEAVERGGKVGTVVVEPAR